MGSLSTPQMPPAAAPGRGGALRYCVAALTDARSDAGRVRRGPAVGGRDGPPPVTARQSPTAAPPSRAVCGRMLRAWGAMPPRLGQEVSGRVGRDRGALLSGIIIRTRGDGVIDDARDVRPRPLRAVSAEEEAL